MAHLWTCVEAKEGWQPVFLGAAEAYELRSGKIELLLGRNGDEHRGAVLLVGTENNGERRWVLLARREADVLVNGRPLALGTRVLCDRDEIFVAGTEPAEGRRYYYSTEQMARREVFERETASIVCPRCRQPIAPGNTVVRCPNPRCRTWHHQEEGLPCWTYAATCALCDQPTPLEAGYRWTPEGL
jgi:hypothetical protein